MMRTLLQDLRFGMRALAKRPSFSAVAVLTLALGVGANTAIFSVVNAVLLRPLPVSEPERLVGLYRKIPQDPEFNRFSYPNYLDVRDRARSFEGLAAYFFTPFNLSGAGETERVWGKVVSPDYFSVLGVEPARGRVFLPDEDGAPAAQPVAVFSHGLWRRRFGSDPSLVGRTVTLNGHAFTIVGVAPESFKGVEVGMAPDVFVPVAPQSPATPKRAWLEDRGIGWLRVVGRLKAGVTIEQAQAEMQVLGDGLRAEHPKINETFGVAVVPDFGVHPQFRGAARGFLLVLMAVVGLVLLIACANVANLMLARAAARRQEMGLRAALGAGRARLVRQLLTESLLLAALGGAAGLLITPWLIAALGLAQRANPLPTPVDFQLDYRVLGFSVLVSLVTGVVFGLAPALSASRTDLVEVIKGGVSGNAPARTRLRSLLVGAQVALSLVLLVCAGLFLRSLQQAQRIEVGFETEGQLLVSFDLGLQGYDAGRRAAFLQQLTERVGALPGVESVGLANVVPLGPSSDQDRGLVIDGYTPPSGLETVPTAFNVVGADYFKTMGIPVAAGREFDARDHAKAPPAVIVNEAAARRFWPGREAVGRRVRFGPGGEEAEVVGVARDSKYVTLGEGPRPYLYSPMAQVNPSSVTLQVRAAGDPAGLAGAVRREVQALDRDLPLYNVMTMDEHLRAALGGPRVAAAMLGAFGLLALVLAAVGVYGVVAYSVTQRTREIGVRMALGGRPADVVLLMLRKVTTPLAVGLFVGLGAAAVATRLLSSFLYGVSATDPVTFVVVPLLLGLVALAASLVPARRAARIDPVKALRYE